MNFFGTFRRIGVKEGQWGNVLRVEVLKTISSRLPIPTIFPAHTFY